MILGTVSMGKNHSVSRRRVLTAAGCASTAGLTGCLGLGSSQGSDIPDDARSAQTKFRHDWPIKTKNNDNIPFDYRAVEGTELDPVTVNFAGDETPWMKQHALMIKSALNRLGAPVQLKNTPLNVLYGRIWDAATGQVVPVSMNTHGPDPQRGLDPNPFLMRMHPEIPGNYYNYWNEKITSLLDKQGTMIDNQQRRAELVKEIQQRASEDAYLLSIAFPDVITAANTAKWNGYVPTPGNGTTRDAFIWTQVNLQPQTDDRVWVKGVTTSMGGLNLAWAGGGPEAKRLTNIYDGLYDASPELDTVPALATNTDVVDSTTIEMDLREGVTWHDGQSFGPDDVKFSTELFKQHASPEMAPYYEPIESVEVLSTSGGGRVRFTLNNPDASFLTQRVVRSIILPKHQWKQVSNPARHSPDLPVGTGPFRFVNWDQGSQFEVERWDDHWMWNDNIRKEILGDYFVPGSGIDGIIWVNVANTNALLGALKQGTIDAIGTTLSVTQAETAAETAGIEKQTAKNFAPLDVHLSHICPLFRDKVFRKALSHTIDKKGFVDSVLQGQATVAHGQNLISPLLEQWHNENIEPYEFDPPKARTLLRKAGYTRSDDSETLVWPEGDAWDAFIERVEDGHSDRTELNQPDFSS